MSKIKLAVFISGRGSNLVAIVDAIQSEKLDASVEVVISNNEDAQGLEFAKKNGIEAVVLDHRLYDRKTYDQTIVETLAKYDIDYIALAGFMRILGPEVIRHYEKRIVNIHPSLLPSFKGINGPKQALEYGVKVTGCTVHFVDNTLDGGAIICQKSLEIDPEDTEETLIKRVLQLEHESFPLALQYIAEDKIKWDGRRIYIKENKK